jgi:hypothetical protein
VIQPGNEPSISRSQLEKIVREILADMLGIQPKGSVTHNREWYGADEAYKLLDLGSVEKLHKKRRNGILKEGFHCRTDNDSPNAKVPRWQYHISRCREALAADDARRKTRRSNE